MRLVIVPYNLRIAIYEAIDKQLELCQEARPDREYFYQALLEYFDKHGIIPDFKIEKKCINI